MKDLSIIIAPVFSEKASACGIYNTYVFKVTPKANKSQIRAAIESFFKVTVQRVSVSNMNGKVKRTRGRLGKRSDWKKAYITLKKGDAIELAEVKT